MFVFFTIGDRTLPFIMFLMPTPDQFMHQHRTRANPKQAARKLILNQINGTHWVGLEPDCHVDSCSYTVDRVMVTLQLSSTYPYDIVLILCIQ